MFEKVLRILRKKSSKDASAGEKAAKLFNSGHNCAQAVLQAVTGIDDPKIIAMCRPFGGGIGAQKCLCGAVTGGVMALGFCGGEKSAGVLIKAFREKRGATCCSVLSRPFRWNSAEHRANCRTITEETADLAAKLLGR